MKIPKLRLCRRRVGVIGLYRSGKTVFLTSLINHLQNHNPNRFPLGKRAQIAFAKELQAVRFEQFPYRERRNMLVNKRRWPEKTRSVSEYSCRYYRSDWKLSRGELSLLDFPGERLADLIMVNASYGQWSDFMMTLFRDHEEYRVIAQQYADLTSGIDITESTVIDSYRHLMHNLFMSYRPVVSPSAFLLSPDGDWIGDIDDPSNSFMQHCYSGLSEKTQFVPLSEEARRMHPDLSKKFSRRYAAYRRRIALPLSGWMRSCDALVVLIDVTALLAGGEGMYQGNRELLRNLIDLLNPGKTLFGLSVDLLRKVIYPFDNNPLKRFVDLSWRELSRIAFVATKVDKVHESNRGRLRDLVREMTEGLIAAHQVKAAELDVGYFACAAVKSTRSTADGKLQAYLGPDTPLTAFTPSAVPESWPMSWKHGEYQFPNVAPWVPSRRDAPPDHIELNRVAEFLMK